jgi:hypothetical protein
MVRYGGLKYDTIRLRLSARIEIITFDDMVSRNLEKNKIFSSKVSNNTVILSIFKRERILNVSERFGHHA